ncbi:GGDEF domain-containing response regulator [Sulfurimonas sp.]
MRKILIVDDSKLIVNLLEEELNKSCKSVEVLTALTYKDGLKYILKYGSKIEVAILDLHLPDAKDGMLVEIADSNDIKVIVLSGTLNKESRDMVFSKSSIIDCIAKDGKKSIKSVIASIRREIKNIGRNILLVDDSRTQVFKIAETLKKMNLNVTIAHDGEEAYNIIKEKDKKFSLVLTDYNMPKMDGLDLIFKIREEYDKDELGIIAMSSSDDTEIISRFLKVGANDFIKRPYNEIEFITRINANLDLIDLFENVRDMANKDFLTGAYNRRYFFETGNMIIAKAKRANKNISVAMLDIDKFKSINDTYGHAIGDEVIRLVVDILQTHLRSSDLIARFGGEEFCILLEDLSKEDAEHIFEKIRVEFENHILEESGFEIKFTVSIGIYYGETQELEDMIKIADDALYNCKNSGRNRIKIEDVLD